MSNITGSVAGFPMTDEWFETEHLHRVADAGDLAAVQELIDAHYSIHAFDRLARRPLHYAVLAEHFSVVDFLLRNGADINASDKQRIGDTPLSEAVPSCSLAMAQLLVASGA